MHVFARAVLRSIARFALAAILFAQGAIALAACEGLQRSAAQAIAAVSEHNGRPCHEGDGEGAPNANVCLEHCLSGDRSLDAPRVEVPVRSPAPLVVPQAAPAAVEPARYAVAPGTAPPPHILFCSLRI